MNKTSLISITIIILAVFASVFIIGSKSDSAANSVPVNNSEIRDGVQYITIKAGGGYYPKITTAQAGIPTKLIVKTNGVYDCSASLAIHSIGFQEILPQTGETEIDIGTPEVGQFQGVCGMGMYNFMINFD